ncbi:MAG: HlyD family efflux transporter periplasmic adaptor subunit [Burkholderiales bacterium]|nr:HlyD family efflux transporter periplasmic adaptor subunit [Burkholderiales bacterium]
MRPRLTLLAPVAVVAVILAVAWGRWGDDELPPSIAAGNGRLEAESIDIATKSGGRLLAVNVREGDTVAAGDEVGRMDTQTLQAQLRSAQAQSRQAQAAVATLASVVRQREQAVRTVEALATQRAAEAALAERELRRVSELVAQNFISPQQLDAAESRVRASRAALEAVRSQRLEAEAAVAATRSQLAEANAAIESARAAVERVQVEIADAVLRAPRAGRVQTVLAHAGEVLAPGGRVATLVDLTDVTMSFFLPERAAGRVAIGSEARLVLDAAPGVVIPARVDFVASVAQFTPKTVETESERQKMVFKVQARVAPELLERYRDQVKTGLPGMAYVRIGEEPWPVRLAVTLPVPAASATSAPAAAALPGAAASAAR